jgi:hypothetical protein
MPFSYLVAHVPDRVGRTYTRRELAAKPLLRLLYPAPSAQTGRRKGDDLVLRVDGRQTADHPAQVVADSGPR